MIKLIITVFVFSALWLNSFSQFRKNAVVLDIAGKAFSIYDISYERYLTEKLHFGVGIGLEAISKVYYTGGETTNLDFRFPLYGAYSFGKKKHHVITELGVTFEEHFMTHAGINSDLWPFISCGYEFRGSRIIFRVPVYLTYVGQNAWWPSVLPWAGLSIGMPF